MKVTIINIRVRIFSVPAFCSVIILPFVWFIINVCQLTVLKFCELARFSVGWFRPKGTAATRSGVASEHLFSIKTIQHYLNTVVSRFRERCTRMQSQINFKWKQLAIFQFSNLHFQFLQLSPKFLILLFWIGRKN